MQPGSNLFDGDSSAFAPLPGLMPPFPAALTLLLDDAYKAALAQLLQNVLHALPAALQAVAHPAAPDELDAALQAASAPPGQPALAAGGAGAARVGATAAASLLVVAAGGQTELGLELHDRLDLSAVGTRRDGRRRVHLVLDD